MAKKRRGVNRRDLTRAQAEAKVRFGPERSTLAALLDQAESDYKTDVRTAQGTTATAIRGARRSIPQLRKVYNQAASGVQAAQHDVEAAFNQAGLTPDNSFRLASEAESGAYRQKMAAESASAAREAKREINEARLGRVFALGAAKEKHRADLTQLSDRLRDLGDREGAYIVQRIGEIGDTRASRNTQLDVAKQYGANERAAGKLQKQIAEIYAGGGGGKGGGKPASRSELRSFKSNYAKALRYGKDYAAGDRRRRDARDDLTTGRPKAAGSDAIPSIADQLAIGVALDMAYKGHVSRENAQALRDVGIRIADLPGAVSYRRWRRQARQNLPEIAGQLIPGF